MTEGTFQLTVDESAQLLRIVSSGALIRRHRELFHWLNGEVQHFLPHEILIAAWGDFASGRLRYDVVSDLAGARTTHLLKCCPDELIARAHARWQDAGQAPVLLSATESMMPKICGCPMHVALSGMRSVLVHGWRDQRTGDDSLYIVLSSGSLTKGRCRQRFLSLMEPLVTQIEGAFRRIAALPSATPPRDRRPQAEFDLSVRELQILESLCQGKTNGDIAAELQISPFTVKNHVQRIFRKIGVANRTQAALRYNQTMRPPQAARMAAGSSA
jgi:transcriptional regulator EpsA